MKRPTNREQDPNVLRQKAYATATARCATTEQCTADWRRKFATYGLSREDSDALIDRLVDEGFIDEARYARAYVHDKVHYDHWGPLKVRAGLAAKRIASTDIAEALDEIPDEMWNANLRAALKTKARSLGLGTEADNDPDEPLAADVQRANKQKLLRFAASRGYAPAEIFRVLDELHVDCEEEWE